MIFDSKNQKHLQFPRTGVIKLDAAKETRTVLWGSAGTAHGGSSGTSEILIMKDFLGVWSKRVIYSKFH